MNLASSAKNSGSGHLLWPRGVDSIQDVPQDLVVAIEHAYKILSWHENMVNKEDIPPEWMWSLDWELEVWFLELQRKREAAGTPAGGGAVVEDAPMMQNELAAGLRE